MFREEGSKDEFVFDNDTCQFSLLDESKAKLETKGILCALLPQTCDCNKLIELPVPRKTHDYFSSRCFLITERNEEPFK